MTVILLRHGRSVSNTAHTLAGRSVGVELDEKGTAQAAALVERLDGLPIRALVRSPLLRCRLTLEPLAAALGLDPVVDERLSEVDYGQWTGRKLSELVTEPLWSVVQQQPSAAVFPEGEGLAAVQARAVSAVRDHDRRLAAEHGADVLWVACTHGDVIKSVVADALASHLDVRRQRCAEPPVHLAQQRPDPLGQHRDLLLFQHHRHDSLVVHRLQVERPVPGLADGPGDESVGCAEDVDRTGHCQS
jgi:probable phosphomutase (TIGR03848 family)